MPGFITDTFRTTMALGENAHAALLSLSILGGIGAGYGAAKLTAKGKQDTDTAKKEYENERLKSDLGYLSSKVDSEYKEFKRRNADTNVRKPARLLN